MEEQLIENNKEELSEDFRIDVKRIFYAIWYRKKLLLTVFAVIFTYFVLSTFFTDKIWSVNSNLYINKANSTNYAEINPFALEEGVGIVASSPLANEIEIMKSPLVIDKVIKENDLKYGKLYGIFPTKKTGEYISTEAFLKGTASFENKKGTNIVSISYKSKNREKAYNIVNSMIKNYIALHKEINSEKSKSDKKIIETEYNKAKEDLKQKVSSAGLPSSSFANAGGLAVMSSFSGTAREAISSLQSKYVAGEKARVEISEEENKVAQLASKLEWAKLVEEMSDTSKVLIIKEPTLPKDWEFVSPQITSNIFLGLIIGLIFSLVALLIAELFSKKLSYLMIGNNIVYNLSNEFNKFQSIVYKKFNKRVAFILFENIPNEILIRLQEFKNIQILKADISEEFMKEIQDIDFVIFFEKINETNAQKYKIVKDIIINADKKIEAEVLL